VNRLPDSNPSSDPLAEAREWLAGWDDAEDARVGGVVKPIQARLVHGLLDENARLQVERDEAISQSEEDCKVMENAHRNTLAAEAKVRELESALARIAARPFPDDPWAREMRAIARAALAAGGRSPGMWRCECGAEVTTRTCGICGRSPGVREGQR
jgi:hypothetical protein